MPSRTYYFTKENLAKLLQEPNASGLLNKLLERHYKRLAKIKKTA
jgi:hypothetical protein